MKLVMHVTIAVCALVSLSSDVRAHFLMEQRKTEPEVANATIHDHAAAAQKSADEAQFHLEQAKKAFTITKTNAKEIKKTGEKIEGTSDKIKTLYTPEESSAESAVPTIFAVCFAVVMGMVHVAMPPGLCLY